MELKGTTTEDTATNGKHSSQETNRVASFVSVHSVVTF